MAKFVPQAELPVSEQAQIRRDKLAALQAEGRDPFLITKFDGSGVRIKIKLRDLEGITAFGLQCRQLVAADLGLLRYRQFCLRYKLCHNS